MIINGANGMAEVLLNRAKAPPVIHVIEIEFNISFIELNGAAQRNESFTSPDPIFPLAIKFNAV